MTFLAMRSLGSPADELKLVWYEGVQRDVECVQPRRLQLGQLPPEQISWAGDPQSFFADPEPAVLLNADAGSSCFFNAHPDPA